MSYDKANPARCDLGNPAHNTLLDKMKRSVYNTICWNPVDSETDMTSPPRRGNTDYLPHTELFLDYFKKCGDFLIKETRSKSARRKLDFQDQGEALAKKREDLCSKSGKFGEPLSKRRDVTSCKSGISGDPLFKRKEESYCKSCIATEPLCKGRDDLSHKSCHTADPLSDKRDDVSCTSGTNEDPVLKKREETCSKPIARQRKRSAFSSRNTEARVPCTEEGYKRHQCNVKGEEGVWCRGHPEECRLVTVDKKKMEKSGQGEGEKESRTRMRDKHSPQDNTSHRHSRADTSNTHRYRNKSKRYKQIYELSQQQCRNLKEKGYVKVNVKVKPNVSVSDFDIVIRRDKIKPSYTRSRRDIEK